MNGEVFVDTNIWLYAVLDSPQERKKHKKALIVAAAWLANCETLFSEDMQDGLIVDGQVKILNPLR